MNAAATLTLPDIRRALTGITMAPGIYLGPYIPGPGDVPSIRLPDGTIIAGDGEHDLLRQYLRPFGLRVGARTRGAYLEKLATERIAKRLATERVTR